MPLHFRYEKRVKTIYSFDIWAYHLMIYVIHDHCWNNLPYFSWNSSFWAIAAVSLFMWTYMVLYRAFGGTKSWDRCPHDTEMVLWFMNACVVHPIFFYNLAWYAKKWTWFYVIILYRGWAARQMLLFLQEVREKMVFLRAGGRYGRTR